jgi:hypothetical protein
MKTKTTVSRTNRMGFGPPILHRALWAAIALSLTIAVRAHDPAAPPPTWNREISRIVYDRCASCHRPGGLSFSLMTYQEAQPRIVAIKASVLSRQMPPWGAVKGFGDFRNDGSLSQEQISLITDWVDGGAPKGNNPRVLPAVPTFEEPAPFAVPPNAVAVSGELALTRAIDVDGVIPERMPPGSRQIVAVKPDGAIEPLVWLYEYRDSLRHPFLFRRPVRLTAGTLIKGVPREAKMLLIPSGAAKP